MKKTNPNRACFLRSSSRREGIVSIRIFIADPTVWTMNDHLRFLPLGNLSRERNSFLLSGYTNRSPLISLAFYLPTTLRVRSDVLIFSHFHTPFYKILLHKGNYHALMRGAHLLQITLRHRSTTLLSHNLWHKFVCRLYAYSRCKIHSALFMCYIFA